MELWLQKYLCASLTLIIYFNRNTAINTCVASTAVAQSRRFEVAVGQKEYYNYNYARCTTFLYLSRSRGRVGRENIVVWQVRNGAGSRLLKTIVAYECDHC